jgi:hypothetical protein
MATTTLHPYIFGPYTISGAPILTLDEPAPLDTPVDSLPDTGVGSGGLWLSGSGFLCLEGRPGRRFVVNGTSDAVPGFPTWNQYCFWYETGSPGPANREFAHNNPFPLGWHFHMPPTGRMAVEVGQAIRSIQFVGDPEPEEIPTEPDQQLAVAALDYAEGGFAWAMQALGRSGGGGFAGTGVRYLARVHAKHTRSAGQDFWNADMAVNGVNVGLANASVPESSSTDAIRSVLMRPFNGLHGTEIALYWLRIGTEPGSDNLLFRSYE